MTRRLRLLGSVLCASVGLLTAVAETDDVFLFSFFRDNGQAGLFLATSLDGLKWEELTPPGRSFLQPTLGGGKLMRDPCLRLDPDGNFHLVWTTGWNDRIIGYASSKDLLTWSEQTALPVMMHEPTARNAWAPELFQDEATGQWLIIWSTTIPGRFSASEASSEDQYNHRPYYTATRDFKTFTPTKLFYDGGFNVIDATLVRVGSTYRLVVKDETLKPVRKHLRVATADRAEGAYGPAGEPFTLSWVEGPSVLKVGDGWNVYFDHYAKPQYYGVVRTSDWKTWEDLSPRCEFPKGARHGTMLTVPGAVVSRLRDAK